MAVAVDGSGLMGRIGVTVFFITLSDPRSAGSWLIPVLDWGNAERKNDSLVHTFFPAHKAGTSDGKAYISPAQSIPLHPIYRYSLLDAPLNGL